MLVSVIMSVFNSEEYLEDSINSILNQSFGDFEFIIIDDGSSDNSRTIIERYAAKDARIVFIKNDRNLGLAASLNKGISIAQGQYIARQDADDLSAVNRLEVQLNYAIRNPEVDLIGSDCLVIDVEGNVVYKSSQRLKSDNYIERILKRKGLFPHGSAFIKRSKLLEVGKYDSRFYYVQDGELWLRLIRSGSQIRTIDQTLYLFRLSPISNAKRGSAKIMFNRILRLKYQEGFTLDMDKELEKIQNFLENSDQQTYSYYVAGYWKSLANASYLNNNKKWITYKYLYRAICEKNSFFNYLKYFVLGVIYILPAFLVKSLLANRLKFSA
jgi:glycosyltransferase involved in cell wall biosynthesis